MVWTDRNEEKFDENVVKEGKSNEGKGKEVELMIARKMSKLER